MASTCDMRTVSLLTSSSNSPKYAFFLFLDARASSALRASLFFFRCVSGTPARSPDPFPPLAPLPFTDLVCWLGSEVSDGVEADEVSVRFSPPLAATPPALTALAAGAANVPMLNAPSMEEAMELPSKEDDREAAAAAEPV